ncbi:GNAT family N-acetyltransferase [Brevundimonas sp.]|uniref:GNAT family N-acetyltransferase n=1 Tax=Brevundimonas sp. TaxID=1871086 RepID=UPI0025B7CC72|nr:N-acetyltransferase [Brevundimonas sp.]
MTDAALQTTVRIDAETPADAASVEALVMAAFGPGRYAKTAERIREQAGVAAGFVAREDGRVIGAVRLWTILVGDRPALFLGPITVSADSRKGGLGADLVQACIDHAGLTGVLLVGDAPYFGRFGFRHASDVRLQGPVDPRRVLWLGEGEPSGIVRPA